MSSSILEEIQLLGCPKLQTPINPDALCSLTSIKLLAIVFCPNWRSCWEEGLFCTTSLQLLWIGDFGEEYRYFPWPSTSTAGSPPSSHLTSLEYLCLGGWLEVNSLPDQLELLPVLRELQIWNFNGLESLPEWLGKLSSLQSLDIWNCPLLEKRCEKGIGEDWHKIAHIPKIRMNEEEIHELKCTLSLQMKHETPLQTESSVLGVSIPKSSRQRDMPSLSDKFMKLISLRSKRFLRKLISVKVGQIEFFDLGVQCLISQP